MTRHHMLFSDGTCFLLSPANGEFLNKINTKKYFYTSAIKTSQISQGSREFKFNAMKWLRTRFKKQKGRGPVINLIIYIIKVLLWEWKNDAFGLLSCNSFNIIVVTLLFSLCVGWKGFPRSHWTAWSSRVPRTWGANRTQRREGGFGIRSSSRWGCWVGLNMDLIRNNHPVIVRIVASLREQPQIRVCIPNHAMNRWIRVCVRLVFPNVLWTSQGSDGPEGLSGPKGIRVSLLPLLLSCYVIFYKTLPSDSFMGWITFYWFLNVFFYYFTNNKQAQLALCSPQNSGLIFFSFEWCLF